MEATLTRENSGIKTEATLSKTIIIGPETKNDKIEKDEDLFSVSDILEDKCSMGFAIKTSRIDHEINPISTRKSESETKPISTLNNIDPLEDDFQLVKGRRDKTNKKKNRNRKEIKMPEPIESSREPYLVKDHSLRRFLERYCVGGSELTHLDNYVSYIRDVYNRTVDLVQNRERKNSPTFAVRNANNFLKSIMFNRFVPRNKVHIECGCGRGSNMPKLGYAKPQYVIFVDVSERSLLACEDRWGKNKYKFPATFVQDDFCSTNFLQNKRIIIYKENPDRKANEPRVPIESMTINTGEAREIADVLSCHFAVHYAFSCKENAGSFLDNVVRLLKFGGVFLGTAPYGEKIIEKLNTIRDGSKYDRGKFSLSLDIESLLEYDLGEPKDDKIVPPLKNKSGIPYFFTMKNTIDCRQYTMNFGDLLSMCSSRGLKLLYFNNLFMAYNCEVLNPKNEALMERMDIANHQLDDIDKENMSIYCTFAFVKMRN